MNNDKSALLSDINLGKKRPFFLIDDDSIDVKTVKRAFTDLQIENKLDVASNADEALKWLQETESTPSLILLDLNMPGMNGIEFLKARQQDRNLSQVPVIVLTTSNGAEDKKACFGLGISGYMVKPVEYSKFVQLMKVLHDYWMLSERSY